MHTMVVENVDVKKKKIAYVSMGCLKGITWKSGLSMAHLKNVDILNV